MIGIKFKSIRARLISGYILIVFICICFIEIILIASIDQYYKNSIAGILKNQANLSSTFFHEYSDNPDIFTKRQSIIESFAANSQAQVQLFESNGNILADTLCTPNIVPLYINDIEDIKKGNTILWNSSTLKTNEPLMGVTIPLFSNQSFIGYARFITSMEKSNNAVQQIIIFLIAIGLMSIFICIILGYYISKTFSVPIGNITRASRKMTNGDYSVRIKEKREDEIGQLGLAFNKMASEIQDREEIKNNFISSISHDLRTPLTSIKGWAITLKTTDDLNPDEFGEGIDIIEQECDRLSEMVNRLLDFSKLSSSKVKLTFETIDIKTIIADSLSYIKPVLKEKNVRCLKVIPGNPIMLNIDPFYIKRALDNLLDNASKYSLQNQLIELRLTESEKSVLICINDSGEGIPEEDLPFVKLKFFQGSNKRKGSGMGLAICDEIMQWHDGELIVQNRVGGGTSVCLKFQKIKT
ncbi:MAG: HAMP domain-containing histidine kinase [Caldisericia bacterium]|nr:HAMP domain-containing histidine kinase [Caldisericia bacterium]